MLTESEEAAKKEIETEVHAAAEGAEKEAPCFGNANPAAHEFANKACIYCGRTQPGTRPDRVMIKAFDDDEEN